MIKSMTGYGRGEATRDGYKARFELSSVNSRHLEVSLRLPRGLLSMEVPLRKMVDAKLGRGKVYCQLTLERTDAAGPVALNSALAARYVTALRDFAVEHGIEGTLTAGDLARLPELWSVEATMVDENLSGVLEESLNTALDDLLSSRLAEGAALRDDLQQRMATIGEIIEEIKREAGTVPEQIRQKLTDRVEELFGDSQYDSQRLAQEVAYLAERADVTEECVRLDVHREQFRQALDAGEYVGRRLNFLMQEMNREANTIGSKSTTAELSSSVVRLKEELERVREQVQNIE